jgi:transmembrane sensor
MSADPSSPPPRLVEQALLLVGRVHKGDAASADAARARLQQWRAVDRHHADAIDMAQRLWDATDGSALREAVPRPGRTDPQARRRAMQLLGLAGAAFLTAGGIRWWWQQPTLALALETGHGQLRNQVLSDGTELGMAARTALSVTYYRDRRDVRLVQGEVRFKVAPDAALPFTVHTDWGQVRVLGTVFTVSVRASGMQVAVAEGRVGVWPGAQAPDGPPALVLQAGDGVRADSQGLGRRVAVQPDEVGAWRRGWLVFDDTPLSEVVERWNDYLPQRLLMGPQERLRTLRLSGSFPLRQPQAFLRGLPDMLPVRLGRGDDSTTVIEAR